MPSSAHASYQIGEEWFSFFFFDLRADLDFESLSGCSTTEILKLRASGIT
jgi:hypothetical protein